MPRKQNPFFKYLSKEDHIQIQVANYLKLQYPNLLALHVPNEGRRTPFERFKQKHCGIKAGCPDILIFAPGKTYRGLAIELKIKPNKPTKSQQEFMDRLIGVRWYCGVCYSFEEAKKLIDWYLEKA